MTTETRMWTARTRRINARNKRLWMHLSSLPPLHQRYVCPIPPLQQTFSTLCAQDRCQKPVNVGTRAYKLLHITTAFHDPPAVFPRRYTTTTTASAQHFILPRTYPRFYQFYSTRSTQFQPQFHDLAPQQLHRFTNQQTSHARHTVALPCVVAPRRPILLLRSFPPPSLRPRPRSALGVPRVLQLLDLDGNGAVTRGVQAPAEEYAEGGDDNEE